MASDFIDLKILKPPKKAITFTISEKEEKALQKLKKKINKKHGKYGHITFLFTPTGIGNIIKVHFEVNNKIFNITDLDSW
jgi:hypothetical protein